MLDCQLYDKTISEHNRNYPIHNKNVEIDIQLDNLIDESDKVEYNVYGSDLTSEYVAINADYRS